MPISLGSRFRNAWNAFRDQDPNRFSQIGPGYGTRPDRVRMGYGTDRSIAMPLYNRISIDVASVTVKHVRLDQNGRYLETINSGLNECLGVGANIDQTARAFMQDVVLSLFDEGSVAIVPVDTDRPITAGSFDIFSMRTGKVVQWYPRHVLLEVYNDTTGIKEQIRLPKTSVAIIENPLYAVMNLPNGTLKRLIRKLNLLDSIDDQSGSGKLDLIFQLPYAIKTQQRLEMAEKRRDDLESQLRDSKYGVAYIDATEKVTQLNRPVENNLMKQVEFLTSMLYSQLGLAESVFDGTADEKTMINYHYRTVWPVLSAIVDSMSRSFLTKTARTQGQSIAYFRDPFALVPVSELATIGDSFTRNAILTSNEFRGIIGFKPSEDKDADSLRNKNLNPTTNTNSSENVEDIEDEVDEITKE